MEPRSGPVRVRGTIFQVLCIPVSSQSKVWEKCLLGILEQLHYTDKQVSRNTRLLPRNIETAALTITPEGIHLILPKLVFSFSLTRQIFVICYVTHKAFHCVHLKRPAHLKPAHTHHVMDSKNLKDLNTSIVPGPQF